MTLAVMNVISLTPPPADAETVEATSGDRHTRMIFITRGIVPGPKTVGVDYIALAACGEVLDLSFLVVLLDLAAILSPASPSGP
jgi:hypothetical protein